MVLACLIHTRHMPRTYTQAPCPVMSRAMSEGTLLGDEFHSTSSNKAGVIHTSKPTALWKVLEANKLSCLKTHVLVIMFRTQKADHNPTVPQSVSTVVPRLEHGSPGQ